MRFLITGFAPFGASKVNPSYEAVRRLPEMLGEHEIVRAEIPVVYDRCGDVLEELLDRVQPDVALCLGQAAGREGVSLENTAVNVKAASAPDNAGVTFSGEKIDPAGPESIPARLPLRELSQLLREAGIPTKISYSAGTYVCNNLFYRLLRYAETNDPHLRCGFIHIPPDESQLPYFPAGTPFLPVSEVVRALKLTVAFLGAQ